VDDERDDERGDRGGGGVEDGLLPVGELDDERAFSPSAWPNAGGGVAAASGTRPRSRSLSGS
jgi:hypothetical protein